MSPPTRVAIDLRPLALGPATGIGLIISQILEELPKRGIQFVGVSDRPLPPGAITNPVPVCVAGRPGGRIRWESIDLPRILRSIDPPPDLYHATWNHGIPPGLSFPSILSLHDLIPWIMPRLVPWPKPAWIHRRLYRRAVRGSARRAQTIVTLSEASRRDIASRLPEVGSRVEVVPCAVPRWFRPAEADRIDSWRARLEGRPYWVYFGGFDPRKGLDLLIEAMARAFPQRDDAPTLVLAGARNESAERIAAMATGLGLRAHFPGYVPDAELPALLGGARLFLYPSRYEGFGIPPLLAMAAGTPCVTSDAAALPEVVGDAAILFPAGNAEALANLLAGIARDPERLRPLADRGRERAARFTVERLAERMTRAYERAASSRSGSG